MELRHLRYFIAVALEENVSKAALKLHVSQPALSRQIRDLEEELGFELLERSAKSVRLTEAGRTFLDEASEVIERLEQGIEKARSVALPENQELHIGYAPSLTPRILPPLIRSFQKALPKLKVKIHDVSSDEARKGILEGALQFALLARPARKKLRGLNFFPMLRERIILVASPTHEYAARKSIPISKLEKELFVGFLSDEYPDYGDMFKTIFQEANRVPKFAEEVDSVSSLIASVEIGDKLAILTESITCLAGERLSLISLEPEPEPLQVGLLWKNDQLDSNEEAFLRIARETAPEKTNSS